MLCCSSVEICWEDESADFTLLVHGRVGGGEGGDSDTRAPETIDESSVTWYRKS